MNYSDDDLDTIHRYLLGEMTQAEQAAMEMRIQSDQAWAEQVQREQTLIFVVRHNRRLELKRMLQAVNLDEQNEPENKSSNPKKTRKIRKPLWRLPLIWWSVAAAIALILIVFWPKRMYTPQESFALYDVPFDFESHRGSDNDSLTKLALQQSKKGNSDSVLLLLPSNGNNPDYAFLRGNSFWRKHEYDSAKVAFEIVARADSNYAEYAKWCLAILPLKDGDSKSARPLLEKIAKSKGIYSKNAAKLLAGLKPEE